MLAELQDHQISSNDKRILKNPFARIICKNLSQIAHTPTTTNLAKIPEFLAKGEYIKIDRACKDLNQTIIQIERAGSYLQKKAEETVGPTGIACTDGSLLVTELMHLLRTPTTSLQGYAELVERNQAKLEKIDGLTNAHQKIERNASDILTTISNWATLYPAGAFEGHLPDQVPSATTIPLNACAIPTTIHNMRTNASKYDSGQENGQPNLIYENHSITPTGQHRIIISNPPANPELALQNLNYPGWFKGEIDIIGNDHRTDRSTFLGLSACKARALSLGNHFQAGLYSQPETQLQHFLGLPPHLFIQEFAYTPDHS